MGYLYLFCMRHHRHGHVATYLKHASFLFLQVKLRLRLSNLVQKSTTTKSILASRWQTIQNRRNWRRSASRKPNILWSLQILQWIWQNFENRLAFGDVTGKTAWRVVFDSQCKLYYTIFFWREQCKVDSYTLQMLYDQVHFKSISRLVRFHVQLLFARH